MHRRMVIAHEAVRTRLRACAVAFCAVILMSACAQSVHQTQRLAQQDFMLDPGYAGAKLFLLAWSGYGYGLGYGAGVLGRAAGILWWTVRSLEAFGTVDGGFGAARPPSSMRGPRPFATATRASAVQKEVLSVEVQRCGSVL